MAKNTINDNHKYTGIGSNLPLGAKAAVNGWTAKHEGFFGNAGNKLSTKGMINHPEKWRGMFYPVGDINKDLAIEKINAQKTVSNYQNGWNTAYNYAYGSPSSTGSTSGVVDYSDLFRELAEQNTAVNIAMNRENNQFNHDEAELQRSWEANMSNTAHQREVADLQAAGLNPILSANAGASTPSGSSANASNFAGADTSALSAIASVIGNSMAANAAITSAALHAQATQNAAYVSADATKYASNNSLNSAIYAADQALKGTKYSSDSTRDWQTTRTYVAGVVGAVNAITDVIGNFMPTKILKGAL